MIRAFDVAAFFDAEFAEHAEVLAGSRRLLAEPFRRLVGACKSSLQQGGKLLFFGNGGSAADAQHLATELSVRYKKDRAAIAALALTTDTSTLTAVGNDLGFDEIFARQIEALGRPGDVALGISTSGKSPNIVRALERACEAGLVTAAFTGRDGGELAGRVDHCLIVPSHTTARIQEMHILVGQLLCGALEIELGLVSE
jgi:D-sedoheptulose 7-phosphate isomerase